MDFQSLTRRELQTLCKNNKIPANMTNIAMVDALKALDHVHGLLENPESIPDTPKRPELLSPDLTRTTRRTSTRRKPMAETEKKENTNVSEISGTPVTRNGRRSAAATSARQKIKTHMKEYNEEGQKEEPIIPVVSLRRSARLSVKLTSESTQKKSSIRTEAIKIGILSEEEPEDLEKEKSIVCSETSVIKQNKVTGPVVSGEIFIYNTETCNTDESSVLDSSRSNIQDGEEADESVSDVVSVTEPMFAEVQGTGFLASDVSIVGSEISVIEEIKVTEPVVSGENFIINNNITEACNIDERSMLDLSCINLQDGEEADESVSDDFVLVADPVSSEVRGTGSLTSKKKVAEPLGLSKPVSLEDQVGVVLVPESMSFQEICNSESKEFIADSSLLKASNPSPNKDSIVGELDGSGKRGMDNCRVDEDVEDDDEYDEGLTESGEVSDEVLSELEEFYPIPHDKTSEMLSLETRYLGLCPNEKPEVVDESVELKNNTDQLAGEEPVSLQSEIGESVTDQIQKFDPVIERTNGTDLFPNKIDDIVLAMFNSVPDQLEKCDTVSELENAAADQSPNEALVEEKCSGKGSSSIDESEEGGCIAVLKAASDMAKDILDSSSSPGGVEAYESGAESDFDIAKPFFRTDFHSENGDSALGASKIFDQTNEPATTVMDAVQAAVVSSFGSKGEQIFNVQLPALFPSTAAHVLEADGTATAATDVVYEVPMLNDYMENNKSCSGDNVSFGLHFEDRISQPLSTINSITTPTPRKSAKKNQTPGKSASKRLTPVQIIIFEDNKENNQNAFGFAHANPVTAGVEVEKKGAISQMKYKDLSMRQLIKTIKQQEQQLESKRPALQTLN